MSPVATKEQPADSFEGKYFSGEYLYGDDFEVSALRAWFDVEENGYYQLAARSGEYRYGYHAINQALCYRHLKGRYELCLALGCAAGDDISPLASRVGQFVAIEPAEKWWRSRIGNTPAHYLKPSLMGDIPLGPSSADLVVALGVLHHIPNVSHLLDEIARVLANGGHLVLREPISTMGDWRKPRRGLTANERGIPVKWLDVALGARKLEVLKRQFCIFPLVSKLFRAIGIKAPYNHSFPVVLDSLLCRATSWNRHYHRDRLWKKLAPGSICYVLEKRGSG